MLHKKSKQWIVVSLSALALAGFSGVSATTSHVSANQIHTTPQQNIHTNNIGSSATNLYNHISKVPSSLASSASVKSVTPSSISSSVSTVRPKRMFGAQPQEPTDSYDNLTSGNISAIDVSTSVANVYASANDQK